MAAREARKTEAQLAKEKVAAPHVLKSKKYRYVSGSMVWKVYSHPCSLITMYHISFSVSLIRCLKHIYLSALALLSLSLSLFPVTSMCGHSESGTRTPPRR